MITKLRDALVSTPDLYFGGPSLNFGPKTCWFSPVLAENVKTVPKNKPQPHSFPSFPVRHSHPII
jgi:hypothetical protein